MKKLIALILLIGLSFGFKLKASDIQLVNGLEWEIQDETNIQFRMFNDVNLERLYVYPTNPNFVSTSLSYGIGINTPTKVEEALDELGIDIQAQMISTPYTEKIGFTYYFNGGSTVIQDKYEYLAIQTENDTYYYKINLSVSQGLKIDFDLEYQLDIDTGVKYVSDHVTTNFYINDVLFSYVTADYTDWNHARVYLFNPSLVNHHGYQTVGNYNYWYGYSVDNFKTGFYFTENYFLNYVTDYIDPYDNGDSNLRDLLIADYVADVRANGITVTLPPNAPSLYLFNPQNYLSGIEYWTLILGTYSTINIRVPDLVYDGSEIWGNTLQYRLGSNTYTFTLTDEFNQTIPPIFGFRVAKDFYEISFNSNGGSAVASIYAGPNQIIQAPPQPTRAGYEFLGWTQDDSIASVQPFDSIYGNLGGYPLRQTFPNVFQGKLFENDPETTEDDIYILGDVTYYAIWRKQLIYVYLELNGGTRKVYPNFNNDVLIVEYGDTANQNVYDVPINNSAFRVGYGLQGYYIDEALTTPFNPNVNLTESLTIYAKWTPLEIGANSPTIVNQVLDLLGLFNNPGMILVYFLVLLASFLALGVLGVPDIVLAIVLIAVTSLWFFLGWLTPLATVLMILFIIVIVLLIFKWRN